MGFEKLKLIEIKFIPEQYRYNDPDTNMGLVISPMVTYQYADGLSIKLKVHPDFEGADFNSPISFTCDGKLIIVIIILVSEIGIITVNNSVS